MCDMNCQAKEGKGCGFPRERATGTQASQSGDLSFNHWVPIGIKRP